MKKLLGALLFFCTLSLGAFEREPLWPKGKMPDAQPGQMAAMSDEVRTAGFNPEQHRMPYLEWFEAPDQAVANGACMILISGGAYNGTVDVRHIENWRRDLTERGVQCVNLVYRTPRPVGIPYYQSAWEDGQRAVRLVRSEAARRGYDPEKIGVVGMSAGSHLALLLGTSSQTPAYDRIDKTDDIPCHINWAIVNAPAYVTTDADAEGIPATRQGYGSDVQLSPVFRFDEKTCPMSLHHGGLDPYSPNGSTLIYRQLRRMGIPAELHLYPGRGHGVYGFDRALEFMTQMGWLGPVQPEVAVADRFTSDADRSELIREDVWPEGKTPDFREDQCVPYIEWHIPAVRKTRAIQIIYAGGAYVRNDPDAFEVAPARRYLNALGVTVVTLKYRHNAYWPIDEIDRIPCKVQWGIGIYPAYALTDGLDGGNMTRGNDDSAVLAPEFSFDLDTAPMLFLHGDADVYASMNSVKTWEKMRAMGIQSELHTLALRGHCFQRTASPGTGSYNWLDRIAEYLQPFLAEP